MLTVARVNDRSFVTDIRVRANSYSEERALTALCEAMEFGGEISITHKHAGNAKTTRHVFRTKSQEISD